jgi:hypothetical protein
MDVLDRPTYPQFPDVLVNVTVATGLTLHTAHWVPPANRLTVVAGPMRTWSGIHVIDAALNAIRQRRHVVFIGEGHSCQRLAHMTGGNLTVVRAGGRLVQEATSDRDVEVFDMAYDVRQLGVAKRLPISTAFQLGKTSMLFVDHFERASGLFRELTDLLERAVLAGAPAMVSCDNPIPPSLDELQGRLREARIACDRVLLDGAPMYQGSTAVSLADPPQSSDPDSRANALDLVGGRPSPT